MTEPQTGPMPKRRTDPMPAAPQRFSARASSLVGASWAWHGAMAIGAAMAPVHWPWWLGGVVANHAILGAAGLLPRCALLGPNLRRLPASATERGLIALTFDDGPDPGITPKVLELLDRFDAHATFFCIGERIREHESLARSIAAHGHSIENHTQHHRHAFALLGRVGMRREIAMAQQTIVSTIGVEPRFFRAPAGVRNPLLQPVLSELGLRLTSWTRRGFDTVSDDAEQVLNRLGRGLGAGDILLLHDGHARRTRSGSPVILEVLPVLLQRIRDMNLRPVTLRDAVS
jgi:peptidoglycan-N-acetylglucosamine deacetylase